MSLLKRFFLLGVLLLATLAGGWLVGCASQPSGGSGGHAYGQGGIDNFKFTNTSPDFVDNFNVICADPARCSPSAAGVFAKENNDTLLCTGSLVSPTHVITNKHCIGDQSAQSGSSCEHIKIVFPSTSQYPEKVMVKCARFADIPPGKLTDKAPLGADYAVLELSTPVKRPVLKINVSGIPDGTRLRFHHLDPEVDKDSRSRAVLRVSECTAIMNSLVLPLYNSATSPMLALPRCNIIKGNSGSALVDSSGDIRGLVSSFVTTQNTSNMNMRTSDKVIVSGRGVNMACVKSTALKLQPTSSDCNATLSLSAADKQYKKRLWDLAEPKMQSQFAVWKKQNSHGQLQWSLRTRTSGVVESNAGPLVLRSVSYPSCFQNLGYEVEARGVKLTSSISHDNMLRPVAEPPALESFDAAYGSNQKGAGWVTRTYDPIVLALFQNGFDVSRCR